MIFAVIFDTFALFFLIFQAPMASWGDLGLQGWILEENTLRKSSHFGTFLGALGIILVPLGPTKRMTRQCKIQ